MKAKVGLSFGDDGEDGEEETSAVARPSKSTTITPGDSAPASPPPEGLRDGTASPVPRRLTPNPNVLLPAPKVLTKATLKAEAVQRDALRKEFLAMQEAIKNTEITVPFMFYDGTNIPGGKVKMKKGDHIWLFLERARKVGADIGAAGSGGGTTAGTGGGGSKTVNENRRAWSRVSVDDLICVRGETIVPNVSRDARPVASPICRVHADYPKHYELYYFIANRVKHPGGSGLLFDYSNTAPKDGDKPLLRTYASSEQFEGDEADPALTKVVDRRWYERNKHIFPASMWKQFKAGEEIDEKAARIRRDAGGNALFFS